MSTLRLGIAALAIACTASIAAAQNTTAPETTPAPPADATAAPTPPADMTATPPADSAKSAPAMADTDGQKPPLPGANSFTEGQARERISKAGFEDVQQLKKDDQGVWRGQAKKSGQQVGVALDYRGNIVQQ
jgi:hypothetical protein